MFGAKTVGTITLISIAVASLLAFLLWIQTSRIEKIKEELSNLKVENATAKLTITNLQEDYSTTLELNKKLQTDVSTVRKDLNKKNEQLKLYLGGKLDDYAKTNPALAESGTNNTLNELMQSITKTTGGDTGQSDNNTK